MADVETLLARSMELVSASRGLVAGCRESRRGDRECLETTALAINESYAVIHHTDRIIAGYGPTEGWLEQSDGSGI